MLCLACEPEVAIEERCTGEERATWVLSCIEGGTPKGAGDYEDPEDLVSRCQHAGEELVPACECESFAVVDSRTFHGDCDRVQFGSSEEKACIKHGWRRKR